MHRTRRSTRREGAASSLEFIGLAAAVTLLVATMATTSRAGGSSIGATVADRARALVAGERVVVRTRAAHERRTGGGSVRVRVARDELRMTPVLDPIAWWQRHGERSGEWRGVRATGTVGACAGCAALEWSHEFGAGALARSGDEAASGIGGAIGASGRLALASVDASIALERDLGAHGSAFANARARGTIGVEADAELRAMLTRSELDAQVEAGAMAGAVARAEVRSGVDLLGVSIRQSARAEGWAGAGARGVAGVRVGRDRVEWRAGWGGALGLGGAAEWSGSIDVSGVPARHRSLARDALRAAVLGPLLPPRRVRDG